MTISAYHNSIYTSIERLNPVQLPPTNPSSNASAGNRLLLTSAFKTPPSGDAVEWLMCTASNAGGNLPMCLQKPALPGAIRKDVPLFLEWNEKRRKEGE